MFFRHSYLLLTMAWVGIVACSAVAAPTYWVDHFMDTYNSTTHAPGGDVGPQGTPIDYDFPYASVHWQDKNYGEVHANAGPGSVGIFALAYNNGLYAPQRQEAYAGHQFDVIFASPGSDPISVVMNLNISGSMDPSGIPSIVSVRAGLTQNSASGSYSDSSSSSSSYPSSNGMLAGFVADGSDHTISTHTMANVPVNVPVTMFIEVMTGQAYANDSPTISFGHTLSLSTSGDVFDLTGPDASQIVVTSADAGIVDNRYAIPEPASAGLLAALVLLRRQRRRHAKCHV